MAAHAYLRPAHWGIWSVLETRSLANLVVADLTQLVRISKRGRKAAIPVLPAQRLPDRHRTTLHTTNPSARHHELILNTPRKLGFPRASRTLTPTYRNRRPKIAKRR